MDSAELLLEYDAVKLRRDNMTKLLLEHGTNPNTVGVDQSFTGKYEITHLNLTTMLLLDYGAIPTLNSVKAAARNKNIELFERLFDAIFPTLSEEKQKEFVNELYQCSISYTEIQPKLKGFFYDA